MLNYKTVSYWH